MVALLASLLGSLPASVAMLPGLAVSPAPTAASWVDLVLLLSFAHGLCDFPLQTDKVAVGKCPGTAVVGVPWGYWMAGHCGTHALAVALITGIPWLGAAEFGAHFLIDLLKCRKVFNLATDQTLHLQCKVAWAFCAHSIA
jgi:hypothetical protein